MTAFLQHDLPGSRYMPHGMCYLWEPDLLWLHVISDLATGLAYYAIPPALLVLVVRARRQVPAGAEYAVRGLPHEWMFLAFSLFIVACGSTHFMAAWNVWNADYWLAGGVKALTAAASIATAIALPPLIPRALSLVKQARESEVRRVRLEQANRELADLNERLQELDALKTRLFANVSHELRTPLTLILGPVDRLLDVAPDDTTRADLEVVRRNALSLRRRVDDLLDLSRRDAGEVRLRSASVDVAEIVGLSAGRFDGLARRQGIGLRRRLPASLPAELDADKFERIVDNLLSNAFNFAPPGGAVSVELRRAGPELVLVVEDSGPGIPDAERAAVFEPFRQLDDPARRQAGGAGLGLAIVRDFARLHGGEAGIDDSPLGGARFTVRLPYREPDRPPSPLEPGIAPAGSDVIPAAEAPSAEAPSADRTAATLRAAGVAGRPRALVVEDNPDMLRFTSHALGTEFDCDTATDGAQALERLDAGAPDLIVTDLMMPGMHGGELLAEIRARPALAPVPVLVLTAVAEEDLRVRLLRAGAQDFVTKPFHAAELLARARNLAAVKRAGDVLRGELESASMDLEDLATDLTHRTRQLEAALAEVRQAREEAEAASRAKSDFLAVMSHELRTPLNAVLGYTDLMDSGVGGPITEAQRAQLDRIRMSARHLVNVIGDILTFVRAEVGPPSVVLEDVDLEELLDRAVGEVRPEAELKGLRLEARIQGLGRVRTDRERVRRILANLLGNAVKFTAAGEVRVELVARAGELEVHVRDTGPGIPAEHHERIFDPFWQVDQSATRLAGGTGLGLSIARRLAEQLGGSVAVESEPGRGSEFTARIPVA